MTLRGFLTADRLLRRQQHLLTEQARLIGDQTDEIRRLHLEHARELRGVVCGWIISLERPEVDLREDLFALDRKLANQVAQLEEHIL